MIRLRNSIQTYAWGTVDGLVDLVGVAPTGEPQAELWIGAHPSAPSLLLDGRGLDGFLSENPELLGEEVLGRFGPRLPFLLKVLAIGAPLSVQLHPSAEEAAAGFEREEAGSHEPSTRSFKDPFAKPEILVALEPTEVLVGFREGHEAAALITALSAEDSCIDLARAASSQSDARAALIALLSSDESKRSRLAMAATSARFEHDPTGWIQRLAELYPGDASVWAPLILNHYRLLEGEAVFLPAGVPHAYLSGSGVELMGASDNVVRGGLTPKHVDVYELVRLLAPEGPDRTIFEGAVITDEITAYAPGVPEFALTRVEPGKRSVAVPHGRGPAVAISTGGRVVVSSGSDSTELDAGLGVFISANEAEQCVVTGEGVCWWATVG